MKLIATWFVLPLQRRQQILFFPVAISFLALALTGCGSSQPHAPSVTTTTPSVTTTTNILSKTTNTTTTSTTTGTTRSTSSTTSSTSSGPGGCVGGDTSKLWEFSQKCFCFYTGGCLNDFKCSSSESLSACQIRNCGESPLAVDTVGTSFYNIKTHIDVLTIPNVYITNIVDLAAKCRDRGQATLEQLLSEGRTVFARTEGAGKGPQWQCVHLPGSIGVDWLHVHTFVGSVAVESLPEKPPFAACASAELSAADAARVILNLALSGISLNQSSDAETNLESRVDLTMV